MTAPETPPLTALAALVGRIAQIMQAGDDPAARRAAAASVEELRTVVDQTARGAAPGFDLAQIGDALAVFAAWLRAPSRDSEARAERAMSELQTALGPLVGWDPAREDAERRAQYRREARAALDEIFPRPRAAAVAPTSAATPTSAAAPSSAATPTSAAAPNSAATSTSAAAPTSAATSAGPGRSDTPGD